MKEYKMFRNHSSKSMPEFDNSRKWDINIIYKYSSKKIFKIKSCEHLEVIIKLSQISLFLIFTTAYVHFNPFTT